MSHVPAHVLLKLTVTVLGSTVIVLPSHAQDEEQAPTEDAATSAETTESPETTAIEEIVVVAPKPGSRRRVDAEYEDPARAKLLKEFYRMQELEEEYEWRASTSTDSSSRIKWGYDPRQEYRMRNDSALQDLPSEKTKPATLFRFEF